jgi:hypothetical protein
MYIIAYLLYFKLYIPGRYLLYTIPLISLILISIFLTRIIEQWRNIKIKTALKIVAIIFMLPHFNMNKGVGLAEYSNHYYHQNGLTVDTQINKNLYTYLNSLPKDSVIAAHPFLADGIPIFAQRKVFISSELSHAWFDRYWETISARTYDFFNAYYAMSSRYIRGL